VEEINDPYPLAYRDIPKADESGRFEWGARAFYTPIQHSGTNRPPVSWREAQKIPRYRRKKGRRRRNTLPRRCRRGSSRFCYNLETRRGNPSGPKGEGLKKPPFVGFESPAASRLLVVKSMDLQLSSLSRKSPDLGKFGNTGGKESLPTLVARPCVIRNHIWRGESSAWSRTEACPKLLGCANPWRVRDVVRTERHECDAKLMPTFTRSALMPLPPASTNGSRRLNLRRCAPPNWFGQSKASSCHLAAQTSCDAHPRSNGVSCGTDWDVRILRLALRQLKNLGRGDRFKKRECPPPPAGPIEPSFQRSANNSPNSQPCKEP